METASAKWAIALCNRPLKNAHFLWVPCCLCLQKGWCSCQDRVAWTRQLHSSNCCPIPASGLHLHLLPHPAIPILSAEATLPPRGQRLLCQRCPEDLSWLLGQRERTTALNSVEICWCENALQQYHVACGCNPSNNWLGKFLFQMVYLKNGKHALFLHCLPVREWGINEACTCMCTTFVYWESYLSFTFSFIKLLFWQVLAHMLGQFLEVSSI